jgi:hypothetical protein
MEGFNFTLLVSQYRWSRHSFLVKHDPETFLEKAKAFTAELEAYKRDSKCMTEIRYGDLTYKSTAEISGRYNVNDYGDIYFISSRCANSLVNEAISYYETSRRESAGYKPKALIEDIERHHNKLEVMEILKKHFEIV